jgi:molybdenum cofactor guanylyltransferase
MASLVPTARVTGTILAGGLSRRMFATGGDKGLLDLGGQTMLHHVIARTRPQVSALVLNANGDPARFAVTGLPVVPDPVQGFVGPLAGVLAGVRWTAAHHPDATHTLTVSSDAPFLPLDLVDQLTPQLAAPTDIVFARSRGDLHPVIALWPTALADDLDDALRAGVRKVVAWTDRHVTHAVDIPDVRIGATWVDPFFNANTPADIVEAQRILAS